MIDATTDLYTFLEACSMSRDERLQPASRDDGKRTALHALMSLYKRVAESGELPIVQGPRDVGRHTSAKAFLVEEFPRPAAEPASAPAPDEPAEPAETGEEFRAALRERFKAPEPIHSKSIAVGDIVRNKASGKNMRVVSRLGDSWLLSACARPFRVKTSDKKALDDYRTTTAAEYAEGRAEEMKRDGKTR